MNNRIKTRKDAGQQLARLLSHYKTMDDVIVLALPRGGVPVAYEIALSLKAPLDVLIVRKLGLPGHEEYAMGAIADNDVCVINPQVLEMLTLTEKEIQEVITKETKELKRRNQLYRHGKAPPDLKRKQVILVDDGIATGATTQAALQLLKKFQPKSITLAVPVVPPDTLAEIKPLVNELIYLLAPEPFGGVGRWYQEFPQVSDDEVINLLKQAELTWKN